MALYNQLYRSARDGDEDEDEEAMPELLGAPLAHFFVRLVQQDPPTSLQDLQTAPHWGATHRTAWSASIRWCFRAPKTHVRGIPGSCGFRGYSRKAVTARISA